jgi:hypothetical protein
MEKNEDLSFICSCSKDVTLNQIVECIVHRDIRCFRRVSLAKLVPRRFAIKMKATGSFDRLALH